MTKLILDESFFSQNERLILESGRIKAYTFIYSTGVHALKIENSRGFFVMLPFQGQQIWQAHFDSRELQMQSMFKEPRRADYLLDSYGCLFVHCGFTAMGCPQEGDTHPLHGELPNAHYQKAWIIIDKDEKGTYAEIGGLYNHSRFFNYNYDFMPACRVYENGTVFHLSLTAANNRSKPMEYMYLAHINFRPIRGARLIYSAVRDSEHIKVHKRFPDYMTQQEKDKMLKYMNMVEKDPSVMDEVFAPEQCYDPEIVFAIKYEADENGNAYTLQKFDDGYSFGVVHRPEQLPVGVRWIADTGDEAAMGMVLPATAEHLGYSHAKQSGMVKALAAGEIWTSQVDFGLYTPEETNALTKKIEWLTKG